MIRFMKILMIVPLLYVMIIPVWLSYYYGSRPCSGIAISISDSSDYHFVTKRQLLNLVRGTSERIIGQPVKSVSLNEIENRVNVLRELKVAEVYMTVDGTLHVYVDQRDPVMRVIPDEGGDFFIDDEGVLVRRRNLYTPRLHIIGGNVKISQAMLNGVSIMDSSIKSTLLRDVYHFVRYINSDAFWSAQIDQIFVDGRQEIDLIPRAGNHQIHFGTFDDYKGKLKNLAAFYDKVMPEVGWDKYSTINLEFRDQIVCKRRH
jgi:cell division protein FtsQ